MATGFQPPDSLANFQYYGCAELPPNVLSAFDKATPFDLLLSVHSRSTPITYLFYDKDRVKVNSDDIPRLLQR
jgi:hypothetical protein